LQKSTAITNWVILIFLALTWGSSFILMKKALFTVSGEPILSAPQLASLRIILASACLLPVILVKSVKRIFQHWRPLLAVGLLGNFFPAFLFAFAQTKVNSSLAGILNALVPLFTLLLGVGFYNIKLRWNSAAGIFLGLLGAILLMLFSSGSSAFGSTYNPLYLLLIVLATLFYALSANLIKTYLKSLKSFEVAGGALTLVLLPALIILFSTNFPQKLSTDPNILGALGYTAILASFGTALGVLLYAKLIANTTAVFASTVTYLMPVVAIFWGLIDGETVTIIQFVGMFVILSGIYLVNRNKKG
jgi:drug/metabolite transporter (DMT)-like permease